MYMNKRGEIPNHYMEWGSKIKKTKKTCFAVTISSVARGQTANINFTVTLV